MTVLIVEDYEDTRDLLELIFASAGHNVISAGDGHAAVRMAQTYRPDVILMDLGLPLCDGLQAARRIKLLRGLAQVPILAHTARTDTVHVPGGPFAGVLFKPCAPEAVLAAAEAQAAACALTAA